MMLHRRSFAALAAALTVALSAGCGSTNTAATTPTASVPQLARVVVFVPTADGSQLKGEQHPVPTGTQPEVAAIAALIASKRALPQGTKLIDISRNGTTVSVNFSKEFQDHYPVGSAAETIAVGSVVQTLTSIPGIDMVRILVDGVAPNPTGAELDLSEPLSSSDFPPLDGSTR